MRFPAANGSDCSASPPPGPDAGSPGADGGACWLAAAFGAPPDGGAVCWVGGGTAGCDGVVLTAAGGAAVGVEDATGAGWL
jgi:hypothetical protein